MSLLESFFNMRISHKILKVKRRVNKFRRLSSKKTFVGRGELKHTNSKVIITVYLYNIEKMNLLRKIRKVLKYMYLSKSLSTLSYTKDELNSDEQNEK
jgi:cellulose synthase/poly-beta-1,6-N-acetylglucosamine synthase-like glycosyltransferase